MVGTATLPESMRASVLDGAGLVRLEQRPLPLPGPGEVLVRVTSVGVCGSDVHYYEHGRIGRFVVDAPLVLGHEAAGVIAAVGAGVDVASVGRRVSLEPGAPCGRCARCTSGRYNLCADVRFFATPPYDGAFCEYVCVPQTLAVAVPESVSDDAAALIEPLSVGVWACRRSHIGPDDSVLVTGAGPIGLIAAQTARAFGARSVTVTDVNPVRLELVRTLGLSAVDVSAGSDALAASLPDVLLECSGHPRATWDGIAALAPAGRAVLVGMGGDELQLPLSVVQDRELTITGAFRYANTWPTAVALVASRRVDLDALVTGHVGLADVEAALTAARRDAGSVKVMVHPDR